MNINSSPQQCLRKFNEAIFGPLQVTGEFAYSISNNCEINNELLKYIKNIDDEIKHHTNISQLIEESIFIRVIRINLDYINPIIGLITVKIHNNSYNITHISVHRTFRRQGLAKLMLMALANNLSADVKNANKYNLVSSVISENSKEGIALFRDLNFNEMSIGFEYHMLKPTQTFCKIIDCPI